METTLGYISLIISWVISILLGYHLSKKIHKHMGILKWSILIIATIAAGLIRFRIIDVMGFIVRSNWCLPGLGVGVIIGQALRTMRSKFVVKSVT